jgi:hypothetical protein
MIINIVDSPRKNKRYRVYLDTGKYYDFGLKWGNTFIDHHNEKLKKAYWARHFSNTTEQKLITNLVPSPALFSAVLLWTGPDINENIDALNNMWKTKHENKMRG